MQLVLFQITITAVAEFTDHLGTSVMDKMTLLIKECLECKTSGTHLALNI